jgi:hypothetical protein
VLLFYPHYPAANRQAGLQVMRRCPNVATIKKAANVPRLTLSNLPTPCAKQNQCGNEVLMNERGKEKRVADSINLHLRAFPGLMIIYLSKKIPCAKQKCEEKSPDCSRGKKDEKLMGIR